MRVSQLLGLVSLSVFVALSGCGSNTAPPGGNNDASVINTEGGSGEAGAIDVRVNPDVVVPADRPVTPDVVVPTDRPVTPDVVVPADRPVTPADVVIPTDRPVTPSDVVVPTDRPVTPVDVNVVPPVDSGTPAPDVVTVPDTGTPCTETTCGASCVDTDEDVANCGGCGNDCRNLPGTASASATCSDGTCVIACAAGRDNCSGGVADGCETDLSLPATCGGCGTSCNEPTPLCGLVAGSFQCSSGCEGRTPTRCGGSCVDTTSDPNHCGNCDTSCTAPSNASATCTTGDGSSTCGWVCNSGFYRCGDACVPVAVNGNCSDGNLADGDGCSALCAVEDGYSCTGAPSTCSTSCGDGIQVGTEACDDGRQDDGDGCDSDCALETGFNCSGTRPTNCTAICGNGLLQAGETCDDNNTDTRDGCGSDCRPEGGWTCDGASPSTCVTTCQDGFWVPQVEGCDDGNPTDGDGCSIGCTVETGWDCSSGTCVPMCGDGLVRGSETCDQGGFIPNSWPGPGGGLPPPTGGCDRDTCQTLPGYTCMGEPSVCMTGCGDGIIAGIEQCDDGNMDLGDGCSSCAIDLGFSCAGSPSTCMTSCGDGIRAGMEMCDDGNPNVGDGCTSCDVDNGWGCTGSLPSTCAPVCGDSQLAGGETCDDGNPDSGDGCSNLCNFERGYVCGPELPSICNAFCGDGIIVVGRETCDDVGRVPGDGCNADCQVENNWSCAGEPSTCDLCGNGFIFSTEACDDGGLNTGDGCDGSCQREPGYRCTPTSGPGPSVCVATCGNGIVEPAEGETCDDNWRNIPGATGGGGDGCSSTCTIEPGFSCAGSICRGSFTTTSPLRIPDATSAVTQTLVTSLTNACVFTDVDVTNDYDEGYCTGRGCGHTFGADFYVQITNGGTTTFLHNREHGGLDLQNVFVYDDAAAVAWGSAPNNGDDVAGGTYRPSGSLSVFNNLAANPNWVLTAQDTVGADEGQIQTWTVNARCRVN